MDWIASSAPGAAIDASHLGPDLTQKVEQGVRKGINSESRHVESETKFVKTATRGSGRNFRFPREVFLVQLVLICATPPGRGDYERTATSPPIVSFVVPLADVSEIHRVRNEPWLQCVEVCHIRYSVRMAQPVAQPR